MADKRDIQLRVMLAHMLRKSGFIRGFDRLCRAIFESGRPTNRRGDKS